jgi:F-type H+-transporting ATPase subunit epsilon
MVAALNAGQLTWSGPEGSGNMFVSGGFAEVRANTVRIVSEASEPASDIDVERAAAAAERARERLRDLGKTTTDESLDMERLQASLRRALMRQKVASRIHQ